jgi:hypothetical protein
MPQAEFLLRDVGDNDSPERIKVTVKPNGRNGLYGIEIHLEGYGTKDGDSGPLYIELDKGCMRVLIWDDINDHDPTHRIRLEGAKQKHRTQKFGLTWAKGDIKLANTGFVFDSSEAAQVAGLKGLEWFAKDAQPRTKLELDNTAPIEQVVGQQVDWTVDSNETPDSFEVECENFPFEAYIVHKHFPKA